MNSAQESDLAPFFGDWSQSEKPSEKNLPLEPGQKLRIKIVCKYVVKDSQSNYHTFFEFSALKQKFVLGSTKVFGFRTRFEFTGPF